MGQLSSTPAGVLVPVAAGATAVGVAADTVVFVIRLALKVEVLLDEVIGLTRELRVAVPEINASIRSISHSAAGLDTMLPVITELPSTQQDVRVAVETLQTLVGLANLGIGQLEAIPGARLVRRRITRALSEQRIG